MRELRRLDLRGKGLTAVPDWVWLETDLEVLNVSENAIETVPDAIADLRHLRMLDLGHNALRDLPQGLGDLEQLADFLYLSENQLTAFPAFLGRLQRLKYLGFT